jgi:RHS repeat-associated protein
MSQEQVTKWQADRIAKAQAKKSAETAATQASSATSAFYTGKPFVEETGSYAFMLRQYDPELNRWTTLDPSGYSDGPNNSAYNATPTYEYDWQGLETKSTTLKFAVAFQNEQQFSTALATGVSQGLQLQDINDLVRLLGGGNHTASSVEQAVRSGVLNSVTASVQTTLSQWDKINLSAQFIADYSKSNSWSAPQVLLTPGTSSGQANAGFKIEGTQIGCTISSKLILSADNVGLSNQTLDSTLVNARLNALVEITVSGGVGFFTYTGGSSGGQFLRDISGTVRE